MGLRADFYLAKAIGIDQTIRGWRKKLSKAVPTHYQKEAANEKTANANGRSRLKRLEKIGLACPYELHPEMEVVGRLYRELHASGLTAHLEVSVPSSVHRSGFMRIDIGILVNGALVAAIECKREGKALGENTRQAVAYLELRDKRGIEVFFVNCKEQEAEVLLALKKFSAPP